jgi:hypothetical protein
MTTVDVSIGAHTSTLDTADFDTVGNLAAAAATDADLEAGPTYTLRVDGTCVPPVRPSSVAADGTLVELVDCTGYEQNFPVELDPITI